MNKHLERAGHSVRVDHRSFKAQGIDRQPTIHDGVFAIRMERKGRKSGRREINRTIFKDNSALAYWAEAVINLTKALVLLIPVIANVLETIRMELTVLIYDRRYNRGKMAERRGDIESMKKAIPYIRATNTVLDRKKAEKAELEAELQHIPRIRKKKRSEIETKIYGLSEEITDLTTEHNRLSRIAGSTVEIAEQHIKEEEDNLAVFEKWEDHLYETIEETVAKYEEKKAEAAGCDQAELDNERKKLRPRNMTKLMTPLKTVRDLQYGPTACQSKERGKAARRRTRRENYLLKTRTQATDIDKAQRRH